MKKPKYIIFCFLLMLIFFAAVTAGAFDSSVEISANENRALVKKPTFSAESFFKGTFLRGWEAYLADHVPQRDIFISAADEIKKAKALKTEYNLVEVTADTGIGQTNEKDSAKAAEEKKPKQALIVLPDRILEVYDYDSKACKDYAAAINRYADAATSNIRVYSMLIPMAIEFEEEAYRKVSDSQKDAIKEIYGRLAEGITTVNVYSKLEQYSGEYIYFRTDHHWTALGAYYGMNAFAEVAGFEALNLAEYKEAKLQNYLGSLYRMAPTEELKSHPDTLSYYMRGSRNNPTQTFYYDDQGTLKSFQKRMIDLAFAQNEASYGIFISGDYPMILLGGDASNGRVLTIIKDSFGNALVPWLTPYFEKIIVLDPRTYKEDFNSLLINYNVTDLLILDYMKMIMMPEYIDSLNEVI